jgi:PAS domain S-box-containing protein
MSVGIIFTLIGAVLLFLAGAGSVYLTMRQSYRVGRAVHRMKDGMVLLDDNYHIVNINPQFEILSGFSAQPFLSQPYSELLRQFDVNEHALANTSNPRFEILHNNRILEPVESVLYDRGGRHAGKVIVFRDVTRRTHAENRLDTKVEMLIALRLLYDEISETLHISTVLMMALDAAMRLSQANAGYIALRDSEGHYRIAQHVGAFLVEEIEEILNAGKGIAGRVIRQQRAECVLDVFRDRDYHHVLLDAHAVMLVPLMLAEENIVGLLMVATPHPQRFTEDTFQIVQLLSNRIAAAIENARLYEQVQAQLAELRHNHEKIRQLEQLKTDMIRIAAHDLGTPLSTIRLRGQLLERSGEMNEKQTSMLDGLMDAAKQMEKLIQNILSLERIEHIVQETSFDAQINLYHESAVVVDIYQEQAQRKSVALTFTLNSPKDVTVRGEQAQLREAISNLVGNAVKYTPTGGDISVTLTQDDAQEQVELLVKDNGYGIPEHMQERLFQPFYRAKTHETQNISGTGLGLHLVKRIIERHGGKMIFESVYGAGSTFGFWLPLAVSVDAKETSPPLY